MPRPEAPIEAELAASECHDVQLATRAFKNVATPHDIQNFLKQCSLYNTRERRWIAVPARPTEGAQLYRPFVEILVAIVSHFGLSTSREVHGIHDVELQSVAKGQDLIRGVRCRPEINSPSICIQAKVQDKTLPNNFPCFEKRHTSNAQYFMAVSLINVMTDKDFEDVENGDHPRQNRARLYSYARQVFLQQGNRHFVNCFLLTESGVRLYVFARDGLVYSSKVDIHKNANVFVKLILGAASNLPEFVGFDRSIFWQNNMRFINTVDEKENPVTYRLTPQSVMPVVDRRNILGRGTCGWIVFDNEGKKYLFVKDSWNILGRHSEADLLEDAKGCPGVGQVLARQDRITSISKLRNIDVTNMSKKMRRFFQDKQFSRLVLENHGSPISDFRTRRSLLCALYDAINGHRNLLMKGILHRDVSVNNILIRTSANPEFPNRGILIDLDMAIRLEDMRPFEPSVPGTRPFLSVSLLKRFNSNATFIRPRDYMDDLESFFYVLCSICCGYSAPHVSINPQPKNLVEWTTLGEKDLFASKVRLYREGVDSYLQVTEYFGEIFRTLIRGLFNFFKTHIDSAVLDRQENQDRSSTTSCNRTPTAGEVYEIILGLFNNAILSLDLEFYAMSYGCSKVKSDPSIPTQLGILPVARPTAVPTNDTRRRLSDSADELRAAKKAKIDM
ncbi:hypothetical protein HYPSUDRAFT_39923 [Hypholoma sublateritium FD-334 SS-4]|uniref:Fungal-type protein kinase domain-containing protein n=1 Tax=Hypholoma sublateritium (strain FD-334 SS-4) TaxID=945553 RepID=A0A0D2PV91_HYPSF|nr:hypothetical protein HYPSUDRAFT_39923 [Hypholoma sublateritium FD-334 SS-4]